MFELHTDLIYDIGLDAEALYLSYKQPAWGANPNARMVAESLTFTEYKWSTDNPLPKPFLGTNRTQLEDNLGFSVDQFLQAMLERAWERGLRPKKFEAVENEMKAVRYHLEDMRLLAKVRK